VSRARLRGFHPTVADWFESALGTPTRAQTSGWPPILDGKSTLLLAPTGSGKTLAAFLAAIEKLMWEARAEPKNARERAARGCKVLYVSPLKALAVDVERNLRAPIAGIAQLAEKHGERVRVPDIHIRTGDTPAADRARMLRAPPDVLITTPESLYLLLTSQARRMLASVDTVIIDEIHSIVPTKRGAHLFLSLERLEDLRGARGPLQRIGLSATQRPLDEVARLLGGFGDDGRARPVTIVDAGDRKELRLRVEVPDVDLGKLGEHDAPAEGEASKRTIWPELHRRIVELVRAHRSTMVFVNSRRLAERLASALNEVAGDEIALAHHGSIAREKRAQIEERLKRGTLPAIVATSSLELGIDMGAVDLVIQVEAPPSVASGLQRIGRACHGVGGVPNGVVLPKHRGDLLAAAAASASMVAGEVEETFYPRSPLDVLAQQIVAVVTSADAPTPVEALYATLRRAAPFAELPRSAFDGVLDMLSGRYPSDDFAELRPRVTWDRIAAVLHARPGSHRLAITNGGTIPDRGLYGVFLAGEGEGQTGGRRVGELDEEMVFEMREGDVFLLGASSWRAEIITHDRVIVTPAIGQPGRMPFWHGDRPGRPRAFGTRIGELARRVAKQTRADAERSLRDTNGLDAHAARNLVTYVADQIEAAGDVPSDRTIVVERFIDDIGDWRVCVMTPFGTRVHAPWAAATTARLRAKYAGDVDVHYTDDGMAFRVPACDEAPPAELFFPAADDVTANVTDALADTSLFASRFREAAARALLLPRRDPRRRSPLWAQRKRAADLLAVASRHPAFPIVLETYRECLRDAFDVTGLVEILRAVEARRVRVVTADTRTPSPFASNVLFAFVAAFMYDYDAPLAERRAQALTIDLSQLRELLGEVELRQLLDPQSIEEHERALQLFTHPARHADAVHDILRRLGALSASEVAERCEDAASAKTWLRELVGARRVFEARIGGSARFAAIEDAGRLRDALGIVPPPGTPLAFLDPVPDALAELVQRHARTHGPFIARDVADRLGVSVDAIERAIEPLVRAGRVVAGEFFAVARGAREYCDAEVLAALRRRSLAALRREVEPVDATAYARFLPAWQGVTERRRGADALLAAIAQLEGAPLVASVLESEIFPARIDGYATWDLDALCASGEVVWAGIDPLGASDGRIALYLSDHEAALARPARVAEGELAAKIRALLERRGAVFFAEIARECGGFPGEALEALWDMVWSGEVTNDTLEPLRSRIRAAGGEPSRRSRMRAQAERRAARVGPPGSEGRWSLRASRAPRADVTTSRAALARALLERYGIVTRETAHGESIEGGFGAVYEVLKAMEEAGRVRRGYFVDGRGGAQFAIPGADDRLRAMRDASEDAPLLVLAATDPANAYGASLPWPESTAAARPQRAAGALVVLRDGALLAWLGRSEQPLLTFLPAEPAPRAEAARAVARALGDLVARDRRRRAVLVTSIDGDDAAKSALAEHFVAAGFSKSTRGLLMRAKTDDDRRAPDRTPLARWPMPR
jgi:ATP-dependent Lhr-like helicase